MKKIYLFFVFVLCFFSTKAYAADYYWTGKGPDVNYNTLSNWAIGSESGARPTVVPGINDNVFFTDGAIKFNVNFNQSNIVFNNFTSSSSVNNYIFRLTAPTAPTKTLTINGVMNLSSKASFNNATGGNINSVGSIIFKNSPIFNGNELVAFLIFNSGTSITIANNFNAMSIIVDNGTTLDLSNRTINLKKYSSYDDTAGMFKIINSTSGIKLNGTTLNTESIWLVDFDAAKSDFANSTLYIHGGSYGSGDLRHNTTVNISYLGLTVEKTNVTLPKVIIDNANNYSSRTCSIINNNNLTISDLTIKNTNTYFDTTNLTISNLTIDKGYEYRFYGTSTQSTPSTTTNVKVTTLNFNPDSSGTTNFKSYLSRNNTLAYLDIPITSTPVYNDILANGIYSKKTVTFTNSVLENLNVNINVTSGVGGNYYWRGGSDGKTWTDLGNWSSSASAAIPVTTLPSIQDNVFFNNNSIISGRINLQKVIDIHDFTVEPDFIGKTVEIFSDNHSFTVRGSLQLQQGVTFSIRNLFFVPKSTDFSAPEKITLNNGILQGTSTIGGNKIVVTGGGTLSLEGPVFTYYNATDSNENSFIFENGQLIFNAATINFSQFISVIETDSSFKTNLYLNNSIINTKSWTYNNKNDTNPAGKFTLDAGTSTINYYQSFSGAGDTSKYIIANKMTYNKIVLLNSISALNRYIYGVFDANYLELGTSVYFNAVGSGIFTIPANQVNIKELKVSAGNLIGFKSNYRINVTNKYQTVNSGSCQLVTILDGESNTVNFIVASTLTDETSTANILTLKNYDVKNIKFNKSASYTINISGSVDSNTTGYTNITAATPSNLYWIGSSPTTNQWHNSTNWTTNLDGTPNTSSCSPTKFDNAHFKSYSNIKSNEVAVNNDIYVNNIIFENDSPAGMSIKGDGSRDIYLSGSIFLNNNIISGFNRLLTFGKQSDVTYDGTARHKIQLKGTDFKVRVNMQDGSYYKLIDDYKSSNSGFYFYGSADLDASNIKMTLGIFDTTTSTPVAVGKLNINNSNIVLSQTFNSNTSSFLVTADNAAIKLNSSSSNITYLNPTNSSTAFSTAVIEFTDAKATANSITGASTAALLFKSITTRGVAFNVRSSVTTETLNSLSNIISIAANKELKVTKDANLSGTSCDVTRSIVSATAGTRAKFTITGDDTNFDYLTIKDLDGEASYQPLIFGTYSANGGNNTTKIQFLDPISTPSTHGFDAVYACRDITVDNVLSADGFYPNAFTTFKWYKIDGATRTLVAETKDINLNQLNFGYGEYELMINYDPSTAGSCVITDSITISPFPTAPNDLADDKFCKKDVTTLADIVLPGYDLVWYDSANSTTALPSTTMIVSGSTYYVARKNQSNTGLVCESTDRLALVLTLDACGGVYINPALRMRSF